MSVKCKINIDNKELEKAIKSKAEESLHQRTYDIECPHCHATFQAKSGNNICPHCHNTVTLNLDIKF